MECPFFIYPYGAYYDVSIPQSRETSSGIIVYTHVAGESRSIESLEGIFVCIEEPKIGAFLGFGNPVCQREQMKQFEERYHGRFVPFDKKRISIEVCPRGIGQAE